MNENDKSDVYMEDSQQPGEPMRQPWSPGYSGREEQYATWQSKSQTDFSTQDTDHTWSSREQSWQDKPTQPSQCTQIQRQDYYYDAMRQGQPSSYDRHPWTQYPRSSEPVRESSAGKSRTGQVAKTGKKKLRVLAGILAAALMLTAVFTTGYYSREWLSKKDTSVAQAVKLQEEKTTGGESGATFITPNTGGVGEKADRTDRINGTGGNGGTDEISSNGGTGGTENVIVSGGIPVTEGAIDNGEANSAGGPTAEETDLIGALSEKLDELTSAQSAAPVTTLNIAAATGADLTVTEIYQKVYPSIVSVKTTFQYSGYSFGMFRMPDSEQSGEGSGIIIRSDGFIMTNYHVIAEAIDQNTKKQAADAKIEIFLPDNSLESYSATLVGYDSSTDLAVLSIDKKNLKAAELGNSDELVVGELAVAIGNPGGIEYMSSCTVGVISGLNRTIQTEGYKDIQLIQTDAAINPGNSGGALINQKGQVIGVNSVKIAANAFEGLGFAIPITTAIKICDDLINYTYVTGRPYIGIVAYSAYDEKLAEQYGMPKGVYVYELDGEGPAERAGIKVNDVIVEFNGSAVENFDGLEKLKNLKKPGDSVKIKVYRDWSTNNYGSGNYVEITLTLAEKKT